MQRRSFIASVIALAASPAIASAPVARWIPIVVYGRYRMPPNYLWESTKQPVGEIVGPYFGEAFGAIDGGVIGGCIGGAIDGPVMLRTKSRDFESAIPEGFLAWEL